MSTTATNRVAGKITCRRNGRLVDANGAFTYLLGPLPKREAVVSEDGRVLGYKETTVAPYIEGELVDNKNFDVNDLYNSDDETWTLELGNGKVIVLRNGWYAGDGAANANEGKIPVRFEGKSCEEVR